MDGITTHKDFEGKVSGSGDNMMMKGSVTFRPGYLTKNWCATKGSPY